ncbi:sensor domain-containing diguanylate cyclase [Gracilibacillus sp. S3-1-1]|uniref:Sensor domain-containing diguanylate cyclase n=1 Tax=Gracilibacillus pellucidus TaxID=3095368 RepID=A0ACC6M8F2_9BACI|nr:sensor domain-containing diguanylate cyclase [Gracilibacillus sp. S3-1-1]MDX8047148.1 sensor domain-containing diguanylate cyclase [Gracilibacillus sp. S3-1-1]
MEQRIVLDLLELVNQSFKGKKLYLGKTDEYFSIVKMLGEDGQECHTYDDQLVDMKHSICQYVYMGEQKPLIINNTREHPATKKLAITSMEDIGSYMGVPLFYKDGKMFGTICVLAQESDAFSADDIKIVEKFSRLFSYVLELDKLANMDDLTNQYNRRYIYENYAKIEGKTAMLLLDLDNFKAVNDTHGHDVGDLVLREAASRIHAQIGSGDFVARLGGDEFVIVTRADGELALEQMAKKIIQVLSEWNSYPFSIKVSVSIGIALVTDENATDVRQALKEADQAMYNVKKNGKNMFHFSEGSYFE